MTDAVRLLAVWLTPALWLGMPAIILARGPEGLWVGLTLTAAPLIALVVNGPAGLSRKDGRRRLRRVVLFTVAGLMIWANVVVAGDVAEWLGVPRWQAVAVAVLVAWLATAWRGAGRGLTALWLAGLIGLGVPLADLVHRAGIDPLAAWERLATQTAFRFPTSSAWVTAGRTFGAAGGRASIVFTEEHSVTAPSGGLLRGHSGDAARGTDLEWRLSPGQSVTLRTGDRLEAGTAFPLRFEAGKRVPGAPPSGMAWAAWSPADGWRALGLGLTLVAGAVGLLQAGVAVLASRRAALVMGAGLVAAFVWAQGWAIYRVLDAPDLFLGGVTIERLADLGSLGHGLPRWTAALQALVLGAGVASFIASSIALGAQVSMPEEGRAPAAARERGIWAAVIAFAGLASVWSVDPWALIVLALGIAAAGLGPATVWPPVNPRVATAAGVVGLAVFATLTLSAELSATRRASSMAGQPTWPGALREAALTYPALAAVPAGAAVLVILRRRTRRRAPSASRLVRS